MRGGSWPRPVFVDVPKSPPTMAASCSQIPAPTAGTKCADVCDMHMFSLITGQIEKHFSGRKWFRQVFSSAFYCTQSSIQRSNDCNAIAILDFTNKTVAMKNMGTSVSYKRPQRLGRKSSAPKARRRGR
jgi:hypothetical protein